ncbi:serine--tRNA ligase [Anaerotalea alkaliphila]|uniref:Serine--tRNA ligase n=1 Tax=Anaerotalea alkaliphila TaxID=2662126 RepID=A0A7X5KM09_9FIRM|nr:serine--tRNA ligase [Anaerotalea alkaliphila]NDL67294.1 serine--tRNA ligase [Anaerotalea alkaliphila]
MLDLNLIRNNPDQVREALAKRDYAVDFTEFFAWDSRRKEIIAVAEALKAERNKVSKEIPQYKKEGRDTTEVMARMASIKDEVAGYDVELRELDERIHQFVTRLPNLPGEDVLPGGKENNQELHVFGEKPSFDFAPKDHVALAESLGLIDYPRGAKLGGNGFWIYKDKGAILEWALLNYFIEEHLKDGYTFILPPHILTYESGFTAGQFPKFEDDVFKLEQEGKGYMQFLLPTAETALINYHRDEVLTEEELPKKYFAYTPCYRKEAGSYRSEERGMIRGHQFNKVEMFQFTLPEDSDQALEELVGKAERLVQGLGLHYRLSKLAAADCSASMRKTYDIEVWIGSMEVYKEVSSASNAGDYQARRGNMKFKRKGGNKAEFLHTLNASGLATSRVLPAILEQHQNADGSVTVPEVLRKYTGFDILRPAGN